MANRIGRARAYLRGQSLPRELRTLGGDEPGGEDSVYYTDACGRVYYAAELTPDRLARSLVYTIGIDTQEIADESAVPLGASKHRGLPHLPASFEWPVGMYFMAQFNLAELHPHDLHGAFPATGLISVFMATDADAVVVHHDVDVEELRVTPYPDPATFDDGRYYLGEFRDRPSLITFEPGCLFSLGGDAYDLRQETRLIPAELRDRVAEIVGCPVAEWDTDCHVFGRPFYWQGEGEDGPEGAAADEDPRILLFHDEFGEGHLHIWVDREDARRHEYSGCWIEYSGT